MPVLKLKLGMDDCDLSVNNLLPVFNTRLLCAYVDLDARVVPLVQDVLRRQRLRNLGGRVLPNAVASALGRHRESLMLPVI